MSSPHLLLFGPVLWEAGGGTIVYETVSFLTGSNTPFAIATLSTLENLEVGGMWEGCGEGYGRMGGTWGRVREVCGNKGRGGKRCQEGPSRVLLSANSFLIDHVKMHFAHMS